MNYQINNNAAHDNTVFGNVGLSGVSGNGEKMAREMVLTAS